MAMVSGARSHLAWTPEFRAACRILALAPAAWRTLLATTAPGAPVAPSLCFDWRARCPVSPVAPLLVDGRPGSAPGPSGLGVAPGLGAPLTDPGAVPTARDLVAGSNGHRRGRAPQAAASLWGAATRTG